MYFDSYDCASFVIRGLDELYRRGAQVLPNTHLNYTRLNLYSYEPQLIGTFDDVMNNQTLKQDFISFYREFDSKKPNTEAWLEAAIAIFESFFSQRRFYFFYNQMYWYLRLKEKPLEVTFDEIPIGSSMK